MHSINNRMDSRSATDVCFAYFMLARSQAALRIAVPAGIFLAQMFWLFPQLDMATSRLFFDPKTATAGETGFWLNQYHALSVFFRVIDILGWLSIAVSMAYLLWALLRKSANKLAALMVCLSLVVGPTLLINEGLKNHWHRARPATITTFGGSKKFTAAWVISDQCDRNCSFTSGHAGAGFAPVIGYFVSRRRGWLWGGMIFGGIVSITRIMVGAHFLSDVLFAFFVVFLTAAMLAWLLARMKLSIDARHAPSDNAIL